MPMTRGPLAVLILSGLLAVAAWAPAPNPKIQRASGLAIMSPLSEVTWNGS
ncbi:MAG: hypothetical protein WEB59_08605 [Thermoanaerobaculia bacterium]